MSGLHTPGPWVIEDGWLQNERGAFNDGQYLSVCMSETRWADLNLIVAAPDLLSALIEILGPLNVCSDNPHVRDDQVLPVDMTMGELRKARAAIAKARGAA